jgi:prepilin-type N-terminal cleavage/methylation domain-containing protein/prepilin-type processing-associated H-X9-DG protein
MRTRNGFTLLELLITVFIIIAVVVWILPMFSRTTAHPPGMRCKTNLKSIGTGVVTYKSANRERTPVMRTKPNFDGDVNLSPTSTTGSDAKYGEYFLDNTDPDNPITRTEDWSVLEDNGMQNVWLMIASASTKEKAFECSADFDYVRRGTAYKFGWTSPNEYSYSIQWPYARSAAGDLNPAPFKARLENVIVFADRNPGGPVSKHRPPSNHPKYGVNVLWAGGSVETYHDKKNPNSLAGYGNDEIYTNAAGVPGGFPQNVEDTSLNFSPR